MISIASMAVYQLQRVDGICRTSPYSIISIASMAVYQLQPVENHGK